MRTISGRGRGGQDGQAGLPARRGRSCSRIASRGVALLSVLWLVAALSAIAFTIANLVRAEKERTSTDRDSLRAYYIASGAVDRALLYIQWGPQYRNDDGSPKFYQAPMPRMHFDFPTGQATVEIIPENSKLNVNTAKPEELNNLLVALGTDPARAQAIAAGIVDWRSASAGGAATEFDQYYLTLTPSFRSRHASFQEIEELLLVRGVTPDLFYGSYSQEGDGRLVPHAGLRDCLSVYGASSGTMDVNTVEPAVMQAIGINRAAIAAIVAMRNTAPIHGLDQIASLESGGGGFGRLGLVTNSIMTLRATARLKLPNGQLSEVRRSVAAMVKFIPPQFGYGPNETFQILRWYDNAVSIQ
jgi:general secretion pathway protein K